MATMNVSLPDQLKAIVEERVASGEYASASDYVRDLVRKDADAQRKWAELERMIDEARKSGISPKSMDQVFDDAHDEAVRRGASD